MAHIDELDDEARKAENPLPEIQIQSIKGAFGTPCFWARIKEYGIKISRYEAHMTEDSVGYGVDEEYNKRREYYQRKKGGN